MSFKFLGYLWATPSIILWLLVLLMAWATGWVSPCRWYKGAWDWQINKESWFFKHLYEGWAATTLGYIIIWNSDFMNNSEYIKHERRHVWQNWIFGPVFYPLYIVCLPFTGYFNNPFEVDARKHQT